MQFDWMLPGNQRGEETERNVRVRNQVSAEIRFLQQLAGNAAVSAMIAAARQREAEAGAEQDEDLSAWDDGDWSPEEPSAATVDVTSSEAVADTTPATPEGTVQSAAPAPPPVVAAARNLKIGDAPGDLENAFRSLRAAARGFDAEDLAADAPRPWAFDVADIAGRRQELAGTHGAPLSTHTKGRLERMLEHQGSAIHVATANKQDLSSADAANALRARRDADQAALEARREARKARKAKHERDKRLNANDPSLKRRRVQRLKDQAKVKADRVAAVKKEEDNRLAAIALFEARLKYEPFLLGLLRLEADLAAEPEFVRSGIPSDLRAALARAVKGPPDADEATARDVLKRLPLALDTAQRRERDYGTVRTRASALHTRIGAASPHFRGRIAAESEETSRRLATGVALSGGELQSQQRLLNQAEADVLRHEQAWTIATRSGAAFDRLAASIAALPYRLPGDAAGTRLAAALPLRTGGDFWRLQEAIPEIERAEAELRAIDDKYQVLNRRLAYVSAHGTPDATAVGTLQAGYRDRHLAENAETAWNRLNNLMQEQEKPVAHALFTSYGVYNRAGALRTLLDEGLIRPGPLFDHYHTSWDGDGFSVEFGVGGLPDIVIHAHCTKEGVAKDGENAVHWKNKGQRFAQNASYPLPADLRRRLLDTDEIKRVKDKKHAKQ